MKILKKVAFGLLSVILLLVIIVFMDMKFNPQFGGKTSAEDKESFTNKSNFKDGAFDNLMPTSMDMGPSGIFNTMIKYI